MSKSSNIKGRACWWVRGAIVEVATTHAESLGGGVSVEYGIAAGRVRVRYWPEFGKLAAQGLTWLDCRRALRECSEVWGVSADLWAAEWPGEYWEGNPC